MDAESQADISESFEIEAVPSFIILQVGLETLSSLSCNLITFQGHTLLGRIAGADASALTEAIAKHVRIPSSVNPQSHTDKAPPAPSDLSEKAESQEELNKRLHALMQQDRVVLFMKGTPDAPQCGFSRATVQILEMQGVPAEKFKSYNVLEDSQLRQDIKEFS